MSEILKIFIGGLSQDTAKASLDAYFNQFGQADSFIMVDKMTGRSRGFGFVNFGDEAVVAQVLACQHEIDGTAVSCSAYNKGSGGGKGGGGGGGGGGFGGGAGIYALQGLGGGLGGGPPAAGRDAMKCFIGGLSQDSTKASLDAYFGQFGFADTFVMVDKTTGRSRGFGFVNFREQDVMNVVLQMRHEIDGTAVNVSAYADKGGGRPGPGGAGISLGGGGGGAPGAATTAAVVAQVLQSPAIAGLLGGGRQQPGVQQLIQQVVQQALGGVGGGASFGGGGGASFGGGGGGGGTRPTGGAGASPKHLKCFLGGLAQHTTKESLSAYFGQFGQANCIIMMDKGSGRSRGFGFVDFSDEQVMQVVLQSAHQIDGQMVNVSPYGGGPGASAAQQQAVGIGGAAAANRFSPY